MTKTKGNHLPDKRNAPKRNGKRGISLADSDLGKTSRLPGMEDAAIEELEDCARNYAKLRDRRIVLLNEEVDMKEDLLALMKRNNKEKYIHDGIEISITHEKEKVKVIIKEDEEE